jgi:lipoprotein NlpI
MSGLLLAEPELLSVKAQLSIARYTDTLYRVQLNDNERSDVLFQRGIAYDAMGLTALARIDYVAALDLNPGLADAHNSLGVLYIQAGMHMLAYEAFDSTLEINPDYDFALLNRGIALYYGGRSKLALMDTQRFLDKDPTDPFRLLWHYIVLADATSELEAKVMLNNSHKILNQDNWASSIIKFYLGDVPESAVIAELLLNVSSQSQLNYRLCEAYFYLGKHSASLGKSIKAENYFKLALATNVYEYVEHKYARIELSKSKMMRLEKLEEQQ